MHGRARGCACSECEDEPENVQTEAVGAPLRGRAGTAPAQVASSPRSPKPTPAESGTTAASRSGGAAPPSWPPRTSAAAQASSRRRCPTGRGAKRKEGKKERRQKRKSNVEASKKRKKAGNSQRFGDGEGTGEWRASTQTKRMSQHKSVRVVCVCMGGLQQLCNLPI